MGTPSVSGDGMVSLVLLRLVTAVSMSGNISNTTLSTNTIPSHSHAMNRTNGNTNSWMVSSPHYGSASAKINSWNDTLGRSAYNGSINTGNNGAHGHGHNLSGVLNGAPSVGNLAGSLSSTQYVDIIIATKD